MDETVGACSRKDLWLQRWLPLLAERSAGACVLELGCGSGQDSETLAAAGHAVVGVDLSERAIAGARRRVPSAVFHCQDHARLFAEGWRMIGLEEGMINRYERPKAAWEAVLEPACASE